MHSHTHKRWHSWHEIKAQKNPHEASNDSGSVFLLHTLRMRRASVRVLSPPSCPNWTGAGFFSSPALHTGLQIKFSLCCDQAIRTPAGRAIQQSHKHSAFQIIPTNIKVVLLASGSVLLSHLHTNSTNSCQCIIL